LSALLDEVVTPYRGGNVGFEIELKEQEESVEPVFVRQPELLYGLNNIVENATDFARTTVRLSAAYTQSLLQISIIDDGAGFPPDVIDKLGEPYLTTRPRQPKHLTTTDEKDLHEGMGLGFFIAKTFIERSGGTLSIANRHDGKTGAVVTVTWPRSAVEAA
jgi:two-component system sensor histidine kinase RegB